MAPKQFIEQSEKEFEEKLSDIFYRIEKTGVACTKNKKEVLDWHSTKQKELLAKIVEMIDEFGDIWKLEKTAEETDSGCPSFIRINRGIKEKLLSYIKEE